MSGGALASEDLPWDRVPGERVTGYTATKENKRIGGTKRETVTPRRNSPHSPIDNRDKRDEGDAHLVSSASCALKSYNDTYYNDTRGEVSTVVRLHPAGTNSRVQTGHPRVVVIAGPGERSRGQQTL